MASYRSTTFVRDETTTFRCSGTWSPATKSSGADSRKPGCVRPLVPSAFRTRTSMTRNEAMTVPPRTARYIQHSDRTRASQHRPLPARTIGPRPVGRILALQRPTVRALRNQPRAPRQRSESDPDEQRLSLSATQVLASMAAAVTAAFLGSRLGVAGTVIGAGLASVVTVVGSAVFGHSLLRDPQAGHEGRPAGAARGRTRRRCADSGDLADRTMAQRTTIGRP